MAIKALSDGNIKIPIQDAGVNLIFAVLSIGEGTTSAFGCLVLNLAGVSWYFWQNTSGVLRYGIVEPTVATQNTAGAAV